MRWLVSFDVSHPRRRRRICRLLLAHGERIQQSVFEVEAGQAQWCALSHALASAINVEQDHWRARRLCAEDLGDQHDLGLPAPEVAPPVTVV